MSSLYNNSDFKRQMAESDRNIKVSMAESNARREKNMADMDADRTIRNAKYEADRKTRNANYEADREIRMTGYDADRESRMTETDSQMKRSRIQRESSAEISRITREADTKRSQIEREFQNECSTARRTYPTDSYRMSEEQKQENRIKLGKAIQAAQQKKTAALQRVNQEAYDKREQVKQKEQADLREVNETSKDKHRYTEQQKQYRLKKAHETRDVEVQRANAEKNAAIQRAKEEQQARHARADKELKDTLEDIQTNYEKEINTFVTNYKINNKIASDRATKKFFKRADVRSGRIDREREEYSHNIDEWREIYIRKIEKVEKLAAFKKEKSCLDMFLNALCSIIIICAFVMSIFVEASKKVWDYLSGELESIFLRLPEESRYHKWLGFACCALFILLFIYIITNKFDFFNKIKRGAEWILKTVTIAICATGVVGVSNVFVSNGSISSEHALFMQWFVGISVLAHFPVVMRFWANRQLKRFIVPIMEKTKWDKVLVFKTESDYFSSFEQLLHTVYGWFAFSLLVEVVAMYVIMNYFGTLIAFAVRVVMLLVPNLIDLYERLKRPTEEVRKALEQIKEYHGHFVDAQKGDFDKGPLKKIVTEGVKLLSGK